MMPVEDVFSITGRGTVATGRVERGQVRVGDEVEIVGIEEETSKTTVTGVEMFRKLLDYAEAGFISSISHAIRLNFIRSCKSVFNRVFIYEISE